MLKLDEELFWKAYKEAMESENMTLIKIVPTNLRNWLCVNITHPKFLEFILRYPFIGDVQLCANHFYGPELIKKSTEEFQTIKNRFIVIGCSGNGDFISIPRDTWESVGYISHDEFGYDKNDLLNYCPVSKSIGEFYYNTWNVKDYPCDYYQAIRRITNR